MGKQFEITCEDCGKTIGYSDDYRQSHDLRTLWCEDCKPMEEDEEDEE